MRLQISFLRQYPWQCLIVFACLLFASLGEGVGLSTLLPVLTFAQNGGKSFGDSGAAQMVDHLLGLLNLNPSLGSMVIVIAIGLIAKALLTLLAYRQVGYTVAHIATDRRLALLRSMSMSRWEYFLRQRAGNLVNAVSTEAGRTAAAFQSTATLASLASQAIVFLGVALLVDWRAALIVLALGVLIFGALRQFVQMSRGAGIRQQSLFRLLMSQLADSLNSIKPLKSMARETQIDRLLERHTKDLNRAMRTEVLSKETLKATQELMIGLVLVSGIYLSLSYWGMELASVMVLAVVLARLLTKTSKIQQEYQTLAVSESFYWSLQATIDEACEQAEPPFGARKPTLDTGIRLSQLTFGYDGHAVLDRFDLDIPAGEFTALIGPSGAGKTTAVDLIIGLLRAGDGDVLIDGVSINELDIRLWRGMIGYVPQDTVLLHDTILANVTIGNAEISEADARWALEKAGATGFIDRLEHGMHTVVGEHGSRFSGGQRQRIVIARALAHRPKLLILDEATSALDPETERAVSETLRNLGSDYTVLAISHRPTLMELADHVYRIDKGKAWRLSQAQATAETG